MEKTLAYWQDKAATLSIEGRAFIDGEYRHAANGRTFDCLSPIDGKLLVKVADSAAEDVNAAVPYLKARGITVQGEPTTMQSGPSKGLTWIYFLSRWGMQLELVSYPAGMEVLNANPGVLWSPKDWSE